MTEVDPLRPQEVAIIYCAECQIRPGEVLPHEATGFNPTLLRALDEAQKVPAGNPVETAMARAVAIARALSRGRFFPKHNNAVAVNAALYFLRKNGFTIQEGIPRALGMSEATLGNWFKEIAVPPPAF